MLVQYMRDRDKARDLDRLMGLLPDADWSTTYSCSPKTRVVLADGTLTLYGPDVDLQITAVNLLKVVITND